MSKPSWDIRYLEEVEERLKSLELKAHVFEKELDVHTAFLKQLASESLEKKRKK